MNLYEKENLKDVLGALSLLAIGFTSYLFNNKPVEDIITLPILVSLVVTLALINGYFHYRGKLKQRIVTIGDTYFVIKRIVSFTVQNDSIIIITDKGEHSYSIKPKDKSIDKEIKNHIIRELTIALKYGRV